MNIGKRLYWVAPLFAVLVLAGAAVTVTARMTSAGGPASAAEDGDTPVASGTLDDGKDLLPQAGITIDAAINAAQTAASGDIGEVDLEHAHGKLVFNVDVGDKDVKVDASNGSIVSVDSDD